MTYEKDVTKEFERKECMWHINDDATMSLRCPNCVVHGNDIETRGDCKNLIRNPDGSFSQCGCYGREHK